MILPRFPVSDPESLEWDTLRGRGSLLRCSPSAANARGVTVPGEPAYPWGMGAIDRSPWFAIARNPWLAIAVLVGFGLLIGAFPAGAEPSTSEIAATASSSPSLNGFSLASSSIPVEEILAGGPPRDGIAALDHPALLDSGEAPWPDDTRVLGVSIGGVARAYPIPLLDWHELVNDELGGQPILVSYCPLCGTGMVFDRRVRPLPGAESEASGDGKRSFGVSGLLYQSDVLMYDRETESLWSQILARAVTGPSRGRALLLIRSRMDRWGAWREDHPETGVLSRRTGYQRDYERSPYAGYARSERLAFPAPLDNRYPPKTPTLGLRLPNGEARAYPAPELIKAGGSVLEKALGVRVEVVYHADRSAFQVSAPEEVEVVEGFWFAWAAFHPESTVFVSAQSAATDPRTRHEEQGGTHP